jgi:predicted transcriptional regulator
MVLCKPSEKYLELLHGNSDLVADKMSEYERIVSESLSAREKMDMASILEYLRTNEVIDNKISRELSQKSAATVRRYLSKLCDIGLLISSGTTKNTVYRKNERI